jgi:4-amino-4-deoxy-L-arabinose transferase-like glycosyltransferase
VKILFHFFTFSNFELHGDDYLYYAQSEHLAWGYISVPPSIAIFGKIATLIFGNTTFGLRFFPALIGGINLIIIGLAVKNWEVKK